MVDRQTDIEAGENPGICCLAFTVMSLSENEADEIASYGGGLRVPTDVRGVIRSLVDVRRHGCEPRITREVYAVPLYWIGTADPMLSPSYLLFSAIPLIPPILLKTH